MAWYFQVKEQLNNSRTPWSWYMFSWDPQRVGRIVSYNIETSDFGSSKIHSSGPTTTTDMSPFLDTSHCSLLPYHHAFSPVFVFSFWRAVRTPSSFGEACVGVCTPFSSACSFLSLGEISLVGPISTLFLMQSSSTKFPGVLLLESITYNKGFVKSWSYKGEILINTASGYVLFTDKASSQNFFFQNYINCLFNTCLWLQRTLYFLWLAFVLQTDFHNKSYWASM